MVTREEKKGKCILVCAGEFVPIEIDRTEDDFCIAVDGGLSYCQMLGILPDLCIGDFDSLKEEDRACLSMIEEQDKDRVIRLKPEKDDTDTLAAIKYGLEKGYRKFYFYGATGGRLDHTFANLQCLLYIRKHGAKGYLMSADSMITVICEEEIRFHSNMEGTLSLFSMGEKAEGVTISNMKYELEQAVITNDFPIGISNEFLKGKAGCIRVEKGQLLVIVSWPLL